MSRRILQNIENKTVIIGWDNPLQTFFAQEFEFYDDDEKENLLWSVGETFGQYQSVPKFVQMLEQRGYEVPYAHYEMLGYDLQDRHELTPLQKMMKERFGY